MTSIQASLQVRVIHLQQTHFNLKEKYTETIDTLSSLEENLTNIQEENSTKQQEEELKWININETNEHLQNQLHSIKQELIELHQCILHKNPPKPSSSSSSSSTNQIKECIQLRKELLSLLIYMKCLNQEKDILTDYNHKLNDQLVTQHQFYIEQYTQSKELLANYLKQTAKSHNIPLSDLTLLKTTTNTITTTNITTDDTIPSNQTTHKKKVTDLIETYFLPDIMTLLSKLQHFVSIKTQEHEVMKQKKNQLQIQINELVEACRLLYRAYIPLEQRVSDLLFQKQYYQAILFNTKQHTTVEKVIEPAINYQKVTWIKTKNHFHRYKRS